MKYLNKLINEHMDKLTETDLKILDYVKQNIDEIDKYSINELASQCFVSRTTILRLAKKLNFSGYSDFRSYIKFHKSQVDKKTSSSITKNFLFEDMKKTAQLLNKDSIDNIVNLLLNADHVLLIGSWLLKSSCYYTGKRFNYYETKFFAPQNDEETRISFINSVTKNSVILLLSFSGETSKIIEYAKLAKQKGATTVSITSLSKNQLSKLCDINLWANISLIYEEKQNECIASSLTIDYILEEIFLNYLSRINILDY
ncbi:MurR/RpiR family transcriptional regulator [Caldisalinibacter kiritimatiensis]|uniref:RpiR family transcriptional regulator, glv operon transcriptional regulator n=1 Tax=Caldisalinibacter kiritimatiensis TaxID=1304284 RepID=R1CCX5_9FIRM|nr:MurR/RpiR family transcriptional regulator [Caldisalinibacter kiritimatiensis]EOD00145.1 RpiR family transcriptional regulator, glv operon transcriptional regulator [Caldisalinibacter kiritimatiensis]